MDSDGAHGVLQRDSVVNSSVYASLCEEFIPHGWKLQQAKSSRLNYSLCACFPALFHPQCPNKINNKSNFDAAMMVFCLKKHFCFKTSVAEWSEVLALGSCL